MRKLVVLITVFLLGCITAAPKDNQPYAKLNKLSEISGVYSNIGESESLILGDARNVPELSYRIWGDDMDVPHDSIEKIIVSVVSDNEINVRAIAGEKVVRTSQFELGKDFEVLNDRVRIHKSMSWLGGGAGSLYAGPVYTTVDLGIDTSGDG